MSGTRKPHNRDNEPYSPRHKREPTTYPNPDKDKPKYDVAFFSQAASKDNPAREDTPMPSPNTLRAFFGCIKK